jgi:oxygen-independent coproporphyrinogen-3 oxidase
VNEVSERDAFEETVFLGLRLNEGVAVAELAGQFPAAWLNESKERVQQLAGEGMMSAEDGRWKLTTRGRLVSTEIFGELLAVMA